MVCRSLSRVVVETWVDCWAGVMREVPGSDEVENIDMRFAMVVVPWRQTLRSERSGKRRSRVTGSSDRARGCLQRKSQAEMPEAPMCHKTPVLLRSREC